MFVLHNFLKQYTIGLHQPLLQKTLKGPHTPTQIASGICHVCMQQECRWQQQTHRKAMWIIQAEVLLQLTHFMGLLPVLVQLVCLCFDSVRQQ